MSIKTSSKLSDRVDNLERKVDEVVNELGEIKQVFSVGFDKLAVSNEHLSRELSNLSGKMGDAIKHFQQAVPVKVVYQIFFLVFLLVGGIMALRSVLPSL